ncbi:MAG: invasion associated locus B family protein [Silicimonas sp.]|nr:invasion associated locus B family protein [Silicimonas sp.]
MSLTIRSLVVALSLVFCPLVALAQDTSTESDTENAESDSQGAATNGSDSSDASAEQSEDATSESPDSGLSLGTPLDQEGLGQTYVKAEFSDWELRCIRTVDGKDPCQLYQLLREPGGNPVSEINIFTIAPGGEAVAGANIITPLETLLTANLRLAVDGGQAKVYPFSFCRQVGCFARIGLTEDEIAQFRKGAEARILIVPAAAPDKQVVLSASLSGFTAGWNALVEANTAAAAASE